MSLLINTLGSPSAGKTSLNARLFSHLKAMGASVEFVPEPVKMWVYKGEKVDKYGQYYLCGLSIYEQSRLFNKVDFIIPDSSVILNSFYNYYYNDGDTSLNLVCKEFYRKASNDGVQVINFFLPRKKDYVQEGRYQTEQQADEVAVKLKEWLDKENYPYTELDCDDEDRLQEVINKIEEITGMKIDGFSLV